MVSTIGRRLTTPIWALWAAFVSSAAAGQTATPPRGADTVVTAAQVHAVPGRDWLTTYGETISVAPGAFESNTGQIGLVGASRNEDNAGDPSAAIGTMGLEFNFNTSHVGAGWGLYGECRRITAAGACWTMELDATEGGSDTVAPLPYGLGSPTTVALLLTSGGSCGAGLLKCYTPVGNLNATHAGGALTIAKNNADFLRGITFTKNAILGCDGTDTGGACVSIERGRGQLDQWDHTGGGGVDGNGGVFQFGSVATSAGAVGKLLWTDNGLELQNGSGRPNVTLSNTAGVAVATGDFAAPFIHTNALTVAQLNTADASPSDGDRGFVTDATSCTFGTSVGSGGATKCPVVRLGGRWVAG